MHVIQGQDIKEAGKRNTCMIMTEFYQQHHSAITVTNRQHFHWSSKQITKQKEKSCVLVLMFYSPSLIPRTIIVIIYDFNMRCPRRCPRVQRSLPVWDFRVLISMEEHFVLKTLNLFLIVGYFNISIKGIAIYNSYSQLSMPSMIATTMY